MLQEAVRPKLEEVVVGLGKEKVHIDWAVNRYVESVKRKSEGVFGEVIVVPHEGFVAVVNVVKDGEQLSGDTKRTIEGFAAGMHFFVKVPVLPNFAYHQEVVNEIVKQCEEMNLQIFRFGLN